LGDFVCGAFPIPDSPSAALTDLIDCVLGFCGGRNGLLATFADQPSTWCSFEYPDARLSFFTTPIALFFVVRSTAGVHLVNYEFFLHEFLPSFATLQQLLQRLLFDSFAEHRLLLLEVYSNFLVYELSPFTTLSWFPLVVFVRSTRLISTWS
jgi:hypothetical protein